MVNDLKTRSPSRWLSLFLISLSFASSGCGPLHAGAQETPPMPDPEKENAVASKDPFEEIERLVAEQKFEAAAIVAAEARAAAQAAGNGPAWARSLIQEVQLRTGLHGYETTVRFLRQEPWPTGAMERLVLELFYARTLTHYLEAYSWEIGQRERVDTVGEVDLKAWDRDQIFEEAMAAFGRAWAQREAWGGESLGTLAEYFDANDYPARIRGTLRDAVSYLWQEALANSAQWTPQESTSLYRLDVAQLLETGRGAGGVADPSDSSTHPLLRVAAVLGDLEAWHRENQRPEAAFEARRQLLEVLAGSFSDAGDRSVLQRDLEENLERLGRRYAWWSMGKATQAEWVRDTGEPDALIRALEIAREGQQRHQGSVGGRRCRSIAESIELPQYSLEAMLADGPRRRSIEVLHKNIERLFLRAYAIDFEKGLEAAKSYDLLPTHQEIEPLVSNGKPVAAWTVDLPPTRDHRLHRTFVTAPAGALDEAGIYVVAASTREDFKRSGNSMSAVRLVVTSMVILNRELEGGREITVVDGDSGKPLEGVEVTPYRYDWQKGHQPQPTRRTAADGRIFLEPEDEGRRSYFLIARRGRDLALDGGPFRLYPRPDPQERSAALVYTDRSIYRPQQEVLWKIVAYRADALAGRFETRGESAVEVSLVDANGQVVETVSAKTNAFGSASGSFRVPTGRALGAWQVRSSLPGQASIRVEEYKRPTFEVSLAPPATALRLNQPARLEGEAKYYFGLPVTGGEVAWRISREPIYPSWWWWAPRRSEEIVASGEAGLDEKGSFVLSFTPLADERLAGSEDQQVSYRYRVTADLTAEGGETRTASRVFRLGFVAVEAKILSTRGFLVEGKGASVDLLRTDLDGEPRSGEGAWRLFSVEQPAAAILPAEQPAVPAPPGLEVYQTAGDRKKARWDTNLDDAQPFRTWSDGRELARGSVTHGEAGMGTVELPALRPGVYRLRYSTPDDFGAVFKTQQDLVVAPGKDSRKNRDSLVLPLALWAQRSSVAVGETARILVHSGLEDQDLVLERFRGRERLERRILRSQGGPRVLEIPVTAEDRGGFALRLTTVRDYQPMTRQVRFFVPWDDRQLNVSFSTFRDTLRPGARETWRLVVRGADQEELHRGAAEVLAYMVDRSLDLFAPHRPFDPLNLYPSSASLPSVASNLGSRGAVWHGGAGLGRVMPYPRLQGDRLKFYGGYGIGGMGMRQFRNAMAPQAMMMERGGVLKARASMSADAVFEAGDEETDGVSFRGGSPRLEDTATLGEAPPAQEPVRSNFAETAFWHPHLLTGDDGSVAIEIEVPDSVTEWNLWVVAMTRDLRAGTLAQRVRTVKELLVRPYLPRFLREGDRARLKVVVNNAGEEDFEGLLNFTVEDPETGEDLSSLFGLSPEETTDRPFKVEVGGSAELTFPIEVPRRLGTVAFRAVGRAGSFSDGELRPLPVLPSRVHLAQSRFAALRDADRRQLTFKELAADEDPSRIDEQLVVTLEGQLFYSVLSALPYLADYPYECTEQTLNRFLSTGIVSSLYEEYPAVAAMAQKLSDRDTPLEAWDEGDPNRKMTLEETPWLAQAQGGRSDLPLINVLDPAIAAAERQASLAKLEKAQIPSGAFPWWPGGPPSTYMTAYLLQGFSRALEFGIEIPQAMVQRAWGYLHTYYVDELIRKMVANDCCWETVTFLNFVLSSYPDTSWTGGVWSDDDRRSMLDFSFRHWKEHSPLLKGYLTLTLERAGRGKEARFVFDSVMDSAKTERDLGTYWAPEDRSWLWYNDTIDTHAFALRVLSELDPEDARRGGLVQWLMLNKKLNHWQSTRATAEVLYSLVHYLEQEGQLGTREEATITAGALARTYIFEPDEYTGKKNQLVIPGEEIDPATMSTVTVEKETPGLLFASATWHFSTEKLPEAAQGDFLSVERSYFKRLPEDGQWILRPLADDESLEPGDSVEVHLSLRSRHTLEYVHLRDPRGAGFEPETLTSGYKWNLGIGWYEEVRDSGTNFFFDRLPVGEYTFKYRLRATTGGDFRVGPATVQPMYTPEMVAYSSGARLRIE